MDVTEDAIIPITFVTVTDVAQIIMVVVMVMVVDMVMDMVEMEDTAATEEFIDIGDGDIIEFVTIDTLLNSPKSLMRINLISILKFHLLIVNLTPIRIPLSA